MTAANIVTTFRMLVALPFVVLVFAQMHYEILSNTFGWIGAYLLLLLFLTLSLMDNLDGYLARSRNEVTNYGKMLDPIADKVLIGGVLIAFCTDYFTFFLPYTVLFFVREVGVTIFRSIYAKKYHTIIPADTLGKAKTVVQTIAISMWLLLSGLNCTFHDSGVPFSAWLVVFALAIILFLVALFLSYISGVKYVIGSCPNRN